MNKNKNYTNLLLTSDECKPVKTKFKDTNFPYWSVGGNSFECALSKGVHPNACKIRAGGGSGSKKAKKLRAHFMYGP